MGAWLASSIIDPVLNWFTLMVFASLNTLWDLLSETAFVTPDVTQLPQVTALAATCLGVVNVCYVLAFLWTGIQVMARDTIQSRVGPGELIPRLVIGLIAANFSAPICSFAIEFANAVTVALTSQSINSRDSLRQLHDLAEGSLDATKPISPGVFLIVVIGLMIAVLVGALLVQWIVRLGVLILVVGIAPIALALNATPQTEPAAKLWWRTLLGALGTVVLQATALHLVLSILLNPGANLPLLGLPGDPGAVMNLLVVLCLLWGVVKVPATIRRYVTQPKPSAIGTVLRVVLIQQLTHGARSLLTGARRGRALTVVRSGWPLGRRRGPLPPPTGASPGRVGIAYPTGRSVRPYTREELREGVDPYTRALKARQAATAGTGGGSTTAPTGAGPGRVGIAYPTGRSVRPYTPEELRQGVDAYTRSLKARPAAAAGGGRGSTTAPTGAGPGRVGIAYPTSRSVRPYTPEELRQGVDAYTRALKNRQSGGPTPPRRNP